MKIYDLNGSSQLNLHNSLKQVEIYNAQEAVKFQKINIKTGL